MRISDWSSDVCSSDLLESLVLIVEGGCIEPQAAAEKAVLRSDLQRVHEFRLETVGDVEDRQQRRVNAARLVAARIGGVEQVPRRDLEIDHGPAGELARSEERRVGKEGVSTCRSRGAR